MPNLFRTHDGTEWKASHSLPLRLADGTEIKATWAGSATKEKLSWWLSRPGNCLAQGEEITAIAVKADDSGEIVWGEAPTGARPLFVVEPKPPGKDYQLAKMITTAATAAQVAYFRHDRFALFGTLKLGGEIEEIAPLLPPPLGPSSIQGDLF